MTPYAILLVKPTDGDEVIRKAYHAIAEEEHPDKTGRAVTERWYVATNAYTVIKTAAKRENWALAQRLLSGVCGQCGGTGVVGTRMFKGKIRVCGVCKGVGRL